MFENSEYQQRVHKLQNKIKSVGLEAFIVRTNANIIYLTGVDYDSEERKVLMIIPAQGEPSLIVPRMELARLRKCGY